jgi:hypothetical protein
MNTRTQQTQHEAAARNYHLYEALTERAIELRRTQSPRYNQVSRRADMAYAMHLLRIPEYKQTGMHLFIHAANRRT